MALKFKFLDDIVQNVYLLEFLRICQKHTTVSFFSHYSFSSELIWQLSSGEKVKRLHKNQFPATQRRRIYTQEESSSFPDIKLSELSSTKIIYFLLLSFGLRAAAHSLVGISDISKLHALWRLAGGEVRTSHVWKFMTVWRLAQYEVWRAAAPRNDL